jgi:undecaprenyl-diphosphatase
MGDLLFSADLWLFRFLNGTLANPVTDVAMPFITDLTQTWYGRILFAGAWLLLIVRGGRRGRAAALLLVPLLVISDQLSSAVIKKLVMRPRPCHVVDGAVIVEHVRLLVGCGGGYAFPSSHAVNNFAAATFLARYFPRYGPAFLAWASLNALSRISVGVHWPSDVAAGMLIGVVTARLFMFAWTATVRSHPFLAPWGPADGDILPPENT